MQRATYKQLCHDLLGAKPMVFLAGPRQAGKTTLAKTLGADFANTVYFNYDLVSDRKKYLSDPLFFQTVNRKDASVPLVVFDEIHKHRHWKNYLKGVFDGFHEAFRFLVLGSGRLDVYRRGGDSLAGRYLLFHLPPLTLGELAGSGISAAEFLSDPERAIGADRKEHREAWDQLDALSGFPEPFLSGEKRRYRLWSQSYQAQLLREDVRDLTGIRNLDLLENLFTLLPDRVGSLVSMDSLARNVQVSPPTIKSWLESFDSLFMTFRVSPWHKNVQRSLSKEKKLYLFNYPLIESKAARFENMVACELFRAVKFWRDSGQGDYSLHFLRNKEKEEVDFLIAEGRHPKLMVECKLAGDNFPAGFLKFQLQLGIPAVIVTRENGVYRKLKSEGQIVLIASAPRFMAGLPARP